jgi:hypothetical protein
MSERAADRRATSPGACAGEPHPARSTTGRQGLARATIGRAAAVGSIGKLKLSDSCLVPLGVRPLMYLVGLPHRSSVFFAWSWSYITYLARRTPHHRPDRPPSSCRRPRRQVILSPLLEGGPLKWRRAQPNQSSARSARHPRSGARQHVGRQHEEHGEDRDPGPAHQVDRLRPAAESPTGRGGSSGRSAAPRSRPRWARRTTHRARWSTAPPSPSRPRPTAPRRTPAPPPPRPRCADCGSGARPAPARATRG